MKWCPRCRQTKSASEFNKSVNRKDGLQVYCRLCRRVIDKDFYDRNPTRRGTIRNRHEAARVATRKWVMSYLLEHPCVDCGEPDPIVLDFDHVGDDKREGIAEMIKRGFSLTSIRAEVAKCQVRCANCHRRITAKRHGGWWKLGITTGDE